VIAGATATGKTGVSLALGQRITGAEIVSADSRQVYRGMDIGTAKVSAADQALVPHHGIDLVNPDEPFTATDYQRSALEALEGIAARGGVALLVGGTGLYLRAVARGMPLDETGRDQAIRAQLEQRLESEGLPALASELTAVAPTVASRTDLANPRRVVRALERASVVGDRPPPAPRGYPARSVWIGLSLDSPENARRIAVRARAQFEGGLIDEARALRDQYDASLRSFTAAGYQEAFDVLDGRSTLGDAIDRNIARNRQLARRQRTWFRSEPDISWLDATSPSLVEDALAVAIRGM
jgi:tRNA dimethylallyltransferase